MKKINLLEEKKKLNIGEYGDCLVDYTSDYISDAFSYIADGHIDIYYNDLLDWVKQGSNEEYVEQAVQEGYIDTSHFRFFDAIMSGQYIQILEELNENEEDIKINYALNYLINNKGLSEMEENQYNELIENISMCDTTNGIIDEINELLEVEENENN